MPDFLPEYGNTEGPLGFPMRDRDARTLDTLLKSLPHTPEYEYRHRVTVKGLTEVNPGERSDVSWISTESPDRDRDVVVAGGMNDSQFQANPIVTLGHAYWLPPVGRSLWRKRVKDGSPPDGIVGIKAKTLYPPRPEAWPTQDAWPPDQVFALIGAGLMQGKSIGFLPLKVHVPDDEEVRKNRWGDRVGLVIDEWLLLEYACVFLPANQNALVESVSKGALELAPDLLRALGLDPHRLPAPAGRVIPFTPLAEVARAVEARLAALDLPALAEKVVKEVLQRSIGRV